MNDVYFVRGGGWRGFEEKSQEYSNGRENQASEKDRRVRSVISIVRWQGSKYWREYWLV